MLKKIVDIQEADHALEAGLALEEDPEAEVPNQDLFQEIEGETENVQLALRVSDQDLPLLMLKRITIGNHLLLLNNLKEKQMEINKYKTQ
jgi:hypothetical protein